MTKSFSKPNKLMKIISQRALSHEWTKELRHDAL